MGGDERAEEEELKEEYETDEDELEEDAGECNEENEHVTLGE